MRVRHVVLRAAGAAVRARASRASGVVERSAALPAGTRVWFATSAGMAPGDGSLAERVRRRRRRRRRRWPTACPTTPSPRSGCPAVAAWMALTWRAGLRPGERVWCSAPGERSARSAVGGRASRWAPAGWSRCAAARGGRASGRRRPGADEVVPLHRRRRRGWPRGSPRPRGGAVDVVARPGVRAAPPPRPRAVLAAGGRLVNLGGAAGDTADVLLGGAAQPVGVRARLHEQRADRRAEGGRRSTAVLRHAAAGRIAVAAETLPLAEARAGLARARPPARGWRPPRPHPLTRSGRNRAARDRGQHHRSRRRAVGHRPRPAAGRAA